MRKCGVGSQKHRASRGTVEQGTPEKMAGVEIHMDVVSDRESAPLLLAWEPCPYGLFRDLQRALRRRVTSDLGVPQNG